MQFSDPIFFNLGEGFGGVGNDALWAAARSISMQRWSSCLLPGLVAASPSQVLTSAYPRNAHQSGVW